MKSQPVAGCSTYSDIPRDKLAVKKFHNISKVMVWECFTKTCKPPTTYFVEDFWDFLDVYPQGWHAYQTQVGGQGTIARDTQKTLRVLHFSNSPVYLTCPAFILFSYFLLFSLSSPIFLHSIESFSFLQGPLQHYHHVSFIIERIITA